MREAARVMHAGRWVALLASLGLVSCGKMADDPVEPASRDASINDGAGPRGNYATGDASLVDGAGAGGDSAAGAVGGGGDGGTAGCRWGGGSSGCPPPDHCGDVGQPCCASYRAGYTSCYKAAGTGNQWRPGVCWEGICRPDGKSCSDDAECFTGTCALMPDGQKRCSGPCALGVSQSCIDGWTCDPVDDAGTGFCQCASAGAESCNGKDDDCNGAIDDASPGDDELDCPAPFVCSWGKCGCVEADCKQFFPCGANYCKPDSEYCLQGFDAGGWSQCVPLPATCAAKPTCACLANEPCGQWCSVPEWGNYWADSGLMLSCGG